MNVKQSAQKVAELFRAMDLDELGELSVPVELGKALAEELRGLGFAVEVHERYADVERKTVARHALRISRGKFQ